MHLSRGVSGVTHVAQATQTPAAPGTRASRFPSPTWRGHEQQTITAAEHPLGPVAPFVPVGTPVGTSVVGLGEVR